MGNLLAMEVKEKFHKNEMVTPVQIPVKFQGDSWVNAAEKWGMFIVCLEILSDYEGICLHLAWLHASASWLAAVICAVSSVCVGFNLPAFGRQDKGFTLTWLKTLASIKKAHLYNSGDKLSYEYIQNLILQTWVKSSLQGCLNNNFAWGRHAVVALSEPLLELKGKWGALPGPCCRLASRSPRGCSWQAG